MRRIYPTLLAAGLLFGTGVAGAANTTTVIPNTAVKTAIQLRDKAMHDDTGIASYLR